MNIDNNSGDFYPKATEIFKYKALTKCQDLDIHVKLKTVQ